MVQKVDGSIVVSINYKTTMLTDELSIVQREFFFHRTAATTGLAAGKPPINDLDGVSTQFCLVFKELTEHTETCIANGSSQTD